MTIVKTFDTFIQTGYDATIVLICLSLLDTILAIAWRIKKGRGLTSRSMLGGLWQNIGTSLIPFLLQVFASLDKKPNALLFHTMILIVAGFVALALCQSIAANAILAGVHIPRKLGKFLHDYLDDEIELKKNGGNRK